MHVARADWLAEIRQCPSVDLVTSSFADIDLCVKCGLCLPHCPTYGKALDENESPRGRLALIQAWAAGNLEAGPKLLGHVDNCLLCRSCESACPAGVPYGRIVDDFRAATRELRTRSLPSRLKTAAVGHALRSPRLQRLSLWASGALSRTGLLTAMGLGDAAAGLPKPSRHDPWPGLHPASPEEKARVGLFLGCTAELADSETVNAAIGLLTRIGVSVVVPPGQGCCGAMALHAGDRAGFERLRNGNRAAFGGAGVDTIITLASGCGAVLTEYPQESGSSPKVMDISHFLAEFAWPEDIRLQPLPARVLIHSPCSLKNVLKSDRQVAELLRRIPRLHIETLPGMLNCCGAAGTYLLEHPEMARALRQDLLDRIVSCAPDYLISSNVGCAMHLRAGLKLAGLDAVRTIHPVVIMERQAARSV